jgi:hypothetical protein
MSAKIEGPALFVEGDEVTSKQLMEFVELCTVSGYTMFQIGVDITAEGQATGYYLKSQRLQ